MNDRARDVLVDAALRGVRQIKGVLHDGKNGYCAMGVLCEAIRREGGVEWLFGYRTTSEIADEVERRYDITLKEWHRIVHANNELGWDFLDIARKELPS